MDTVQIFDTTLRDGEQSPGFSMNRDEKLRLARQIEELGVDVMEAGFPIASPGDLEATQAVAREIKHCRVAALARACQEDVDAALRGLEPAAMPRLHLFLATSDLHLKHKLRISREEALSRITKMIGFGRRHCEEVEFSAEDASRSDIDYLCEVILAAVQAGATIINLPDTVGYSTPAEYAEMFRVARKHLADYPDVVLSAHCHDDLGLAVANSIAAIEAGVRQIECTINGIGERAGNAALEELARGGGPNRVPPRGRHPSGRYPEKSADVRNHPAGISGRGGAAAASGRTNRPGGG
jgi:2-isopropylmalate synthase